MTDEAPRQEGPARGSVTVHRAELAGPVLNRVLATAAAQAELPLDRVNDVLLLGDELVAYGPSSVDGALRIELEVGAGRLDLRVGPLTNGAGRRLLDAADVAGLGNLLGRLADDAHTETTADGEALVLVVAAERS
jgi:hypothetical protein